MSYEDLVRKMTPKLHGVVHKIRWESSAYDEDDLFQEALLHLWTHWKDGSFDDKTDSYILQGCSFHVRNFMRKEQRKQSSTLVDECRDTGVNTPVPAAYTGVLEEVHSALAPRERKIVRLLADGYTVREIGKMLAVSHVMVVKIVKKIRVKFAAGLPDAGIFYLYNKAG